MSILIAYASKHGAIAGIAERIGAALHQYALEACVMSSAAVPDL